MIFFDSRGIPSSVTAQLGLHLVWRIKHHHHLLLVTIKFRWEPFYQWAVDLKLVKHP